MSGSSQVLAWLKALPVGEVFSSLSAIQALEAEGVSRGAVSGLLARLLKEGKIAVVERKRGASGRVMHHFMVKGLEGFEVRETSSKGGRPGKAGSSKLTLDRIADLLLQVASELSELKTPLDRYDTRELLREVERRLGSPGSPGSPGQ